MDRITTNCGIGNLQPQSETRMEIRLRRNNRSLTETALFDAFSQKRKEEIALSNETIRARALSRARAIKRARNQIVTAALLGETRLYLESV